jgi:sigma-B regulation protein RsbU (phosphoserine phosphatase)
LLRSASTKKEDKPCGATSACAACVLRHSLIQTLIADAPVDRKPLDRIFYISVAASQFLAGPRGLLGGGCQLTSPETVLNHLDEAFPFERFDTYFSIVCMSIDLRRGILTYGGAGHPPPVLLRANGEIAVLDFRGPVIGFGSDTPYGQKELRLKAGDKIILYTDGLTENRD